MKRILLGCAMTAAIVACGGAGDTTTPGDNQNEPDLPSCGSSKAIFTTSPIAFSDLLGWVPLGNLNPPGHLMPTDHQYLYVNIPGSASPQAKPVVSPGNITITGAHRTHYSATNTYDYAIDFSPCAELFAEFGHVTSIVQSLLDKMGPFDQQCDSYAIAGNTFTNCFTRKIEVAVAAGEQIGTTGGQGTSNSLDFTLHDGRIASLSFANPSRYPTNPGGNDHFHIVPASDYFTEPVRSQIRAKLGSFNGSLPRTIEPVGGTIAYDVAGTAQGVWYNGAQPTFPEDAHLAIVLDNVDPTRVVFSTGTSQPGFATGVYAMTPVSSGFVNRDPKQITPDGNIYCFEFAQGNSVILARLENTTTLKVEGRTGPTTCAAQQPWSFTANAFSYVR